MLKKSDYFYELPEAQIAQTPAEPRDSSRLLVYDRATGKSEDRIFRDIKEYLRPGDVLVINNTKVLPARLFAYTENGGRVEVLLLKRHDLNTWEVLVRPGKKAKPGVRLTVSEELSLTVLDRTETGERIVEFRFDGVFEDILSRVGSMPLPPYIHEKLKDKDRYQTVYCKTDGSAAAPTAGLHFTKQLLAEIEGDGRAGRRSAAARRPRHLPPRQRGGLDEPRHALRVLPRRRARRRNRQRRQAGRDAASSPVGTTSVRTLETVCRRKRLSPPLQRRHLHLHLSAVPLQVRRRPHHQFPPPRKYPHHARLRLHGAASGASRSTSRRWKRNIAFSVLATR